MDIPEKKDLTYFAKTNFRGSDHLFGIKRKDRRQHMYLLGKSGTGKSVLLSNMIIQNIKNGEGVCVVDPHGELVEEILHSIPPERAKDVIYFNPADTDFHVGFNVLQLEDLRYKHLVASGLMGIFTKIWANAWSSRMEYILNNAILALLDTPGSTLLGIPRLLVDKDYRQVIINNLKDPVVKAFWTHEYEAWRDQFRNEAIAPIQNKVGQFLSTSIIRNIVGQSKSTIDIFDIMNSGKIFLVNVSKGRIGEDNSSLLGGMIITKLQLAAMERVRIPEQDRRDFYLYVDEFQNFVTDSFASILSEARKYRLNLTIAHQYIGQLVTDSGTAVRDAVFGNVGTMIIFRIGAADADFLEKEFEPEFTPEDLVNLPNYHVYLKLMVDGITSRPFSAKTLPPVKIDVAAGTSDKIIEESRAMYARPRETVEAEITRWSSMVPGLNDRETVSGSPDGKFRAECSNCKKVIYVPFEPEAGRPVYCKECLFKIKNGEVTPTAGFKPPREKQDTMSYDALSGLGIEFTPPVVRKPVFVAPARSAAPAAASPAPALAGKPKTFIQKVFTKPVIPVRPAVSSAKPIDTPKPVAMSSAVPVKEVVPVGGQQQVAAAGIPPVAPVPIVAPKPRTVTPLPRKEYERRKPDVGGLQEALKEALSSTIPSGAFKKFETEKAAGSAKTDIPVVQKTMSLGDLKKEVEKERPLVQRPILKKEASQEQMSALKDAVAKATGSVMSTTPIAKPTPLPEEIRALDQAAKQEEAVEAQHLAEEKARAEQAIAAAQAKASEHEVKAKEQEDRAKRAEAAMVEERQRSADAMKKAADEAERITREKEAEYEKKLEEEKARIEAEVRAAEDARKREVLARVAAEEAQANAEAPAAPKKKRTYEVPEDVLKKILE